MFEPKSHHGYIMATNIWHRIISLVCQSKCEHYFSRPKATTHTILLLKKGNRSKHAISSLMHIETNVPNQKVIGHGEIMTSHISHTRIISLVCQTKYDHHVSRPKAATHRLFKAVGAKVNMPTHLNQKITMVRYILLKGVGTKVNMPCHTSSLMHNARRNQFLEPKHQYGEIMSAHISHRIISLVCQTTWDHHVPMPKTSTHIIQRSGHKSKHAIPSLTIHTGTNCLNPKVPMVRSWQQSLSHACDYLLYCIPNKMDHHASRP